MDTLVLHPSATAQWHALVNEAEHRSSLHLNEDLESYLVFLLMRFQERPEMVASVLALEFLQGLKQQGGVQQLALRDLGDKCLLFSGLYPERAARKHVDQTYFVNLGQSAYGILADNHDRSTGLFTQLSQYFETLMNILTAMRQLFEHHVESTIITIIPRFNQTTVISH